MDLWVDSISDPAKWEDIFDGDVPGLDPSCWRADQLAARNDAHVLACGPDGATGVTVEVETNRPIGESIVPGTADKKSRASATAVVESRCTFELPGGDAEEDSLPRLTCEDTQWELDPEDSAELPQAADLFEVHLADGEADDE